MIGFVVLTVAGKPDQSPFWLFDCSNRRGACQAAPDIHSAKNEFADNPFMAIGVNPRTNVVTGYFSALLTAPGKTDACKFLFHGSSTPDGKVRLAIKDAVAGNQDRVQF